MSSPSAVRHINETRALDAIRSQGSLSRADIARELKVTRATASVLVASLIEVGMLVDESDAASAARTTKRTGRPSTNVCLNPNYAYFLGVEVGVGRGTVAIIDFAGEVHAKHDYRFSLDQNEPKEVAERVANEVRAVLATLDRRPKTISGRISIAGLMDLKGHLVRSPFLGWYDIPFLEMMRSALPEVELMGVENDADAFAAAEMQYSVDRENENTVYLLLDTGIGGCAVVDGNILRGHMGFAGELGHMIIGDKGYSTSGKSVIDGSLESYVGRIALLKRYSHYGGHTEYISEFVAALDGGEEAATSALHDWANHLGRGIASIVSVLAPEHIVVGGALAPLYERCDAVVQATLASKLVAGSHFPEFSISNLGRTAPAIGAAFLVRRDLFTYDPKIVFGK